MKIIIYGQEDAEFGWTEGPLGPLVTITEDQDELFELLDSSEGPCVVFLDFDYERKKTDKLNTKLSKNSDCFRVIFSGEFTIKDMRKHQKGKHAADGYLVKPLTSEIILNTFQDFQLASHLEENKMTEEGTEIKNLPQLSQDETPSEEGELVDEELLEDEDFEPFEPMEMKVSTEVRTVVDLHSAKPGGAEVFESEANKKIQAKFDLVFGARKKAEAPQADERVDLREEKTEPNTQVGPSLNIDEDDSQDVLIDIGEEETGSEEISLDADEDEIEEISLDADEGEEEEISLDADEDEIEEISLDADEDEEEEISLDGDETEEEISLDADEDEIEEISLSAEDEEEDEKEDEKEDENTEDIPLESPHKEEDIMSDPDDKDEIGLELSADDEFDGELELGGVEPEASAEDQQPSGGLELSLDDDDELELGDSDSEEISTEEETGGIELGDSDEGLSLGESDDSDVLEFDSDDTSEDEGLDLSEDDEGLDLDDEGTGELDLGDTGTGELDLGDEPLTGDIDLEEMNLDSDDGDSTDPTMMMSAESLNEGEAEDFLDTDSEDEDEELDDEDMGFSLGEEEGEEELEAVEDEIEEESLDEDDDATETAFFNPEMEEEDSLDEIMEEKVEEVVPVSTPEATTPAQADLSITPDSERIISSYNENEQLRLQATIRQLREERDQILSTIRELETDKKVLEQDNLGLRAELDEAKIEITILKKRHSSELDEMKYRNRISEEKRMIAEEKTKKLQKEFDRLEQKVRVDFNHIKRREKELENQLELVSMDAETQVQTRDSKIMDLKRKIDQLEFNMENAVIREQKSRDDKVKLEDRMRKIMKTLRGSIEVLEDDMEFDPDMLNRWDENK